VQSGIACRDARRPYTTLGAQRLPTRRQSRLRRGPGTRRRLRKTTSRKTPKSDPAVRRFENVRVEVFDFELMTPFGT